jgi:hypothetical protein
MHETISKYQEAIQRLNEAERERRDGEVTEQMRIAYKKVRAAWADIPDQIRSRLIPPPPLS